MLRDFLCIAGFMLVFQVGADKNDNVPPGMGYPGRLIPYKTSSSLRLKCVKFGMSTGWFQRNNLPSYYVRFQKPQVNELPYLLYAPKRSSKQAPMLVYFGGSGEQGTDLSIHFRQTTLFERLTTPEFQRQHPCYIFAPMLPKGAVIRAALPGERSMMADLVCDAMYAVIAAQQSPPIDTNRLYVTGLSWGGVAAFELSCSYPGRFAACVPTSCIQSPQRIPTKSPGNYWMLYNEEAYKSEWSQSAIHEIERIVKNGLGDFRCSTFPDTGHDAWRKAWGEAVVWEWVFSKGIRSSPRRGTQKDFADAEMFQRIAKAKCISSIPGIDEKHGPTKILDGLDTTVYISKFEANRGDWIEIVFDQPIKGNGIIYSGMKDGSRPLVKGIVEASTDDRHWNRVGCFTKDGLSRIRLRSTVKRIKIVYTGTMPEQLILRKIVIVDK